MILSNPNHLSPLFVSSIGVINPDEVEEESTTQSKTSVFGYARNNDDSDGDDDD